MVSPIRPNQAFQIKFHRSSLKVGRNAEFWRTLPLSVVGRVHLIKMLCLPRFLNLFQNRSPYLNASFFKELDSIILPFVWGYKSHKISKGHLHKPTRGGGPNPNSILNNSLRIPSQIRLAHKVPKVSTHCLIHTLQVDSVQSDASAAPIKSLTVLICVTTLWLCWRDARNTISGFVPH